MDFSSIYHNNVWHNEEKHPSRPGSTMAFTAQLRPALKRFILQHEIKHVLDVGCGSFSWMGHTLPAHVKYTGIDVVPELIADSRKAAQTQFPHLNATFQCANRLQDAQAPPDADLVLFRYVGCHLTSANHLRMLMKFSQLPKCRFVIATSHELKITDKNQHTNTPTFEQSPGRFHNVFLSQPPFQLTWSQTLPTFLAVIPAQTMRRRFRRKRVLTVAFLTPPERIADLLPRVTSRCRAQNASLCVFIAGDAHKGCFHAQEHILDQDKTKIFPLRYFRAIDSLSYDCIMVAPETKLTDEYLKSPNFLWRAWALGPRLDLPVCLASEDAKLIDPDLDRLLVAPKPEHKTASTTKTDRRKTIHLIWTNAELNHRTFPNVYKSNVASWRAKNPDWTVQVWTGARLRGLLNLFPAHLTAVQKFDHVIEKCDYLRCFVLWLFGGVYCDMDFYALRSLNPLWNAFQKQTQQSLLVVHEPAAHFADGKEKLFNGFLMASDAKSADLEAWMQTMQQNHAQNPDAPTQAKTGPEKFHEFARERPGIHIYPHSSEILPFQADFKFAEPAALTFPYCFTRWHEGSHWREDYFTNLDLSCTALQYILRRDRYPIQPPWSLEHLLAQVQSYCDSHPQVDEHGNFTG